jgi:hypothetical protein
MNQNKRGMKMKAVVKHRNSCRLFCKWEKVKMLGSAEYYRCVRAGCGARKVDALEGDKAIRWGWLAGAVKSLYESPKKKIANPAWCSNESHCVNTLKLNQKHCTGEIHADQECHFYKDIDTKINQCDSCLLHVSDCGAVDVEFGDGVGNDNVIKCNAYKKKEGGSGT